jgi:predicted Zn-dependent protease
MFAILAGAAAGSYFKSGDIYSFYTRTWIEKVQKSSAEIMIAGIEKRIQRAMTDKKGGSEAETLAADAKRLSLAYPENTRARMAAGLSLILAGKTEEGAFLAVTAGDSEIPGAFLETVIKTLYEQKYYYDIAAYIDAHGTDGISNVDYYYGSSLVEAGRYADAVKPLEKVLAYGRSDYIFLYRLGRCYCETNRLKQCVSMLESAKAKRYYDKDINRTLAEAYKKTGRFSEAERIMRELRK